MTKALDRGITLLGNAHADCIRALENGYRRYPDGARLLGVSVVSAMSDERPADTCARLVAILTKKEAAQQEMLRNRHWSYSGLYHQLVRAALRGELRELNEHLRKQIGE